MTPCMKIWGSLANLEGQNFFCVIITLFVCACINIKGILRMSPIVR